jgi:hypothetical protein
MRLLRLSLLFLILFALFSAPNAFARKKTPAANAIDPTAAALFEKACAHLTGLKGYAFHAEVLLDLVYKNSAKIQVARKMEVAVQRPNAFKIVTTGDDIAVTSIYDGKTFILALGDQKTYGQLPIALDTDGAIELLSTKYQLESPLGDLLVNAPCAKMRYDSASYLGLGFVGDIRCHHLFFQSADIDWQIWIEDGPNPLPRKLIITEKRMPQSPQFIAFLSNWRVADNPPATFDVTPPKDFSRDEKMFTGKTWKR